MALSTRIQKLEVAAAPIKAEQQRRRENQQLRAEIFNSMQGIIDELLGSNRYVFGADMDEGEFTKDTIEIDLLYHHEARERFGIGEDEHYIATAEQLRELHLETIRRFDRHIFGNYQAVEEQKKEQEQWLQVRADIAAGVPSAESEAAKYLRQLFKRYPRKQNAQRFYDIWD